MAVYSGRKATDERIGRRAEPTVRDQAPRSRHHEDATSLTRPGARQLGRPQLLTLQRRAGNAAVAAMVQRDPVAAPTRRLSADVVRATTKDGTAAVIWRDETGTINAIVEFESNATLSAYLAGDAGLDTLVGSGRAMVAEQTVTLTQLPIPATDTGAGSGAAKKADTDKSKPSPAPSMLSKLLEGAFKQLRTARILAYLASKQVFDDAQRAISAALGDLKRLKRQAHGLRNRIAKSGGGAKVVAKLAEVEAEIVRAEKLVAEQKAALRAAQSAMKAEATAANGLLARIKQLLGLEGIAKEKAGTKLWRTAGKYLAPKINSLVRLLEASRSGVRLMAVLRKLKSPWVGRVLIGAAAVFEGINAYLTTKNRTTAGKVADSAITAGTGALVVANPVTALADFVLPKDYKLSTMYRGGSGAITSLGEGLITGDTAAMEGFHEASKRGEYGKVMQLSSEAGDYWAEHGVIGGLKEFGRELWDWL